VSSPPPAGGYGGPSAGSVDNHKVGRFLRHSVHVMSTDYMLQCHSAPSNFHDNKILHDLNTTINAC